MGVRVNGAEQHVTGEIESVQGTVTFEVNSDNVYAYSPLDDSDLELFVGKSPGSVGMFAADPASGIQLQHDDGAGHSTVELNVSGAVIKSALAKPVQVLAQGTGNITVNASGGTVTVKAGGSNSQVTLDGTTVAIGGPEASFNPNKIGFFNATPVVKQTVTGVTVDPAVISLLAKLALMGIIVDGHT